MDTANETPGRQDCCGWREAIGFPHIVRTLPISAQPAKLGLAFAAIVGTFAWGWVLDLAWSGARRGDESAVALFIATRYDQNPYSEPEGQLGPFEVFRRHQRDAMLGFLGSILPGQPLGGTSLERLAARPMGGAAGCLTSMGYGVIWLARVHPFFFVLFAAGALLLWSACGGAICRLAALQFAKDEKPTAFDGLRFARKHWIGGFFSAPCVPLAFVALTMLVMSLGGVFLRIPVLGDFLGGLLFILAILGGLFAALLVIGFVIGGSLFWPAVAVEASDAFDSFSRSLAYTLTRPLKTFIYAVLLLVYAAVCWLLVNLFVSLGLSITRAAVGFGTSPFGWWSRGGEGASVRKLDLLWPAGADAVWTSPNWSALSWYEYVSAGLIAFYVMIVVVLVWSFLCSFYFSGGTVAYFLLRRDVDLADLDEVSAEDDGGMGGTTPEAAPSTPSVSLPVAGGPAPNP